MTGPSPKPTNFQTLVNVAVIFATGGIMWAVRDARASDERTAAILDSVTGRLERLESHDEAASLHRLEFAKLLGTLEASVESLTGRVLSLEAR